MSDSSQLRTSSIWGWRGAASGVVQRLKQILDSGEHSDVEFAVGREHGEEELFRAHKFVLTLGSDVFDTMFHGEIQETTGKTIELPDILPQAFFVLLKYLYTDVVEDLNAENISSALYCSKKYGIPKLFDICVEFAIKNVDKDTCLTIVEMAKVLDVEKLVNRCLEIVDTHCTELLRSPGFLRLKKETVRDIFVRDTLVVNEEEVYNAAQRWAANACRTNQLKPTRANYRFLLGEALFSIRFPLMDDETLWPSSGPLVTGLLLDEELRKLFQFKNAAKKPDIPFSSTPRSSEITFCDHRWYILDHKIVDDLEVCRMSTGNVFFDKYGHLHLRLHQHNGVWKGATVRLKGFLGFGRYELLVEGLNRLEPGATFSVSNVAAKGHSNVAMYIMKMREGESCTVGYSVGLLPDNVPSSVNPNIFGQSFDLGTLTTLSFHWKPDNISFSCQRGHEGGNTTAELCSWSYDSIPNIPQTSLPVMVGLIPDDIALSSGKEVEIIVHSFRFYPGE